jgi:conjugal transfer/entry exclusion protein
MTTLVQYQHQVDELKLENIPLKGVSPDQARESLEKLMDLQKHAQEVERAVKLDLQMIRTQYQSRIAATSAGNSSLVNISEKHRVGGKMRAGEVEKVNAERDSKIAPLEQVEKQLEEILAKVSVARANLEKQAQAGQK